VRTKLGEILLTLAAAASSAAIAAPPHAPEARYGELPADGGRDALRLIVQGQCVVNWSQKKDPAPCERVVLSNARSGDSGYAVLADRKGGAHYLLIPVQTMAGVDAGELLDPDAPNYFAEAWHSRDLLAKFVGHDVPGTLVGLAINKRQARSQDQFHIHIECLRQDVVDSLRTVADRLSEAWSPVTIAGSGYDALRLSGDSLDGANPFELLANLKPDARHHMGDYTLVVAGAQFTTGRGFIVLSGTGQTGELLLDAGCTAAGGGGGGG
jgi:CDP-diacylglycerol pyrophosphatase